MSHWGENPRYRLRIERHFMERVKVRKQPPEHSRGHVHADKRESARELLPATQDDPLCLHCDAVLSTAELAAGESVCERCQNR